MIVDDEAPARSELRFLLEQTGKIGTITEASSVRSAIEMLMESRVDVVFLDISMPGASGLQLAEALHKLKNPPAIVFVTAYSDHAVEAFDVDAVDYLMKPVEEARLDRAIEKVMQRTKPVTDSKVTIERIPVEKGGRKVLIPVDDIRFIMAKDDYSCIYTVDDRFLSTTSLAQFEAKLCDFADTKASVLGVYLPTVLSMDADEHVLCMVDPGDYHGELLLVFENGKVARIPVSAYETKTNRRRLTGAYSDKSPLVAVLPLYEGSEVVLFASDGRALLFPPEAVSLKASRTTQGVAVMALKKKAVVTQAQFAPDTLIRNHARYRARSLPAAGALLREDDRGEEQMSLI